VSKAPKTTPAAHRRERRFAIATAVALVVVPQLVRAGESGTSHVLPGANATLVDAGATSPGWFAKPMYLFYGGSASALVPTAAGVAANLHATVNTLALGGGYTFDFTFLGGAHWTAGAFLPITWLELSGNLELAGGPAYRQNDVWGLGDLTLLPFLLAWKAGDWQFDVLLPIYVPTGNYQQGRFGNTGLNYWTFDPIVAVTYRNGDLGLNAMLRVGYGMNTTNPDTDYHSGSILHFDAAVEQLVPLGPGYLALGAEGFYFQQVTADNGSGAVLGAFEGMTAGLGPVAGYFLPIGKQVLSVEAKWLAELDTTNRLKGNYVWLKAAYKF
jgi:hypothetical protein